MWWLALAVCNAGYRDDPPADLPEHVCVSALLEIVALLCVAPSPFPQQCCTVVLMDTSATRRLGSLPGSIPANKGQDLHPEPLTRAEAQALIAAIPARSMTGMRNRALVTVLY